MPKAILAYATGNLENAGNALSSTANFLRAHGWKAGAGYQPGEPNFAAIQAWVILLVSYSYYFGSVIPLHYGADWGWSVLYLGATLLTFGEPYRAEAFIARLEERAPDLSLDWFRRGTGEFEVVMTYADREEFDNSARLLRSAGFRID